MGGDGPVEIWGSGKPRREFLYVDDLADAVIYLMQRYSGERHVNVGTGQEVSIRELAELIAAVVGCSRGVVFDSSKPDGMPRRLLDVSLLTSLGWTAPTSLKEGIAKTYRWFLEHEHQLRGTAQSS